MVPVLQVFQVNPISHVKHLQPDELSPLSWVQEAIMI